METLGKPYRRGRIARFAAGVSLGIVIASGVAIGVDARNIVDDIHQIAQLDEQYGAASPEYQQVAHALNEEQESTLTGLRYPAFGSMIGSLGLIGSAIAWRRAASREAAQRPAEATPKPSALAPIPDTEWMRPSDGSAM